MKALLELERDFAGVVTLSDVTDSILVRLQRLIGASGSTIFSFDRGVVSTQGGSLEQTMRDYTPDLFQEDLLQQANMVSPAGTFYREGPSRDNGEERLATYLKSRPYADFYRPRDMGFFCGVWPTGRRFGSDKMFGLLFCTPTLSRRFESSEKEVLRHLEVPLRAAARRILRFSALEEKCGALVHLLEQQRGSHVLWDAEGRLVWVSAAAQHLLHGSVPGSDLERTAAVALRQLRRMDGSLGQTLLGRPQRLRSARGAPLLVEFSWLPAADRRPWLLAEVKDCGREHSPLATLTRAEIGVLRLLTRGLSDREIAETLSVSTPTVKTHVKHILSKLGVSSRSKAASLARDAGDLRGAMTGAHAHEPEQLPGDHGPGRRN